jgi:hypothetical protein
MDAQLTAQAKKRFDFDAWRGVNTLQRNLFIWKVALAGYSLPRWTPVRVRPIAVPGVPPYVQSVWRRTQGGTETLLRMDLYECASRVAAHEFLVQLVANFESPIVERRTAVRIGDVAFAGPPYPWLAFARANLVALLRNAGPVPVQVESAARDLDDDLTSEPTATPAAPQVPTITRFATKTKPKKGATVSLDVDAIEAPATPQWYKIFSEGEVHVRNKRLVYTASNAKTQNLVLFAVLANRAAAARKVLQLKLG